MTKKHEHWFHCKVGFIEELLALKCIYCPLTRYQTLLDDQHQRSLRMAAETIEKGIRAFTNGLCDGVTAPHNAKLRRLMAITRKQLKQDILSLQDSLNPSHEKD